MRILYENESNMTVNPTRGNHILHVRKCSFICIETGSYCLIDNLVAVRRQKSWSCCPNVYAESDFRQRFKARNQYRLCTMPFTKNERELDRNSQIERGLKRSAVHLSIPKCKEH